MEEDKGTLQRQELRERAGGKLQRARTTNRKAAVLQDRCCFLKISLGSKSHTSREQNSDVHAKSIANTTHLILRGSLLCLTPQQDTPVGSSSLTAAPLQ